MFGLVFEKLFQAQNQMFSSTRIPDQIDETSSELKNWSIKDFFMIFFPVKAETAYFSDLTLGGPRGDCHWTYGIIKEYSS